MLSRLNNANALSMVGEKALHTLINIAVFAVLARTLGPELFGTFGLIQAVFLVGFHVALFCSEQTIIKFTLAKGVVAKNLYIKLVILKYAASIPVYLISIAACRYFYGVEFALLVVVYCGIHLVNIDQLFFSYFRALEKSYTVFIARMCVYIPLAIVKIVVVVKYSDLMILAIVYLIEAFLLGALAFVLYILALRSSEVIVTKGEESQRLLAEEVASTPGHGYKSLVLAAWPIFSSAVLITLYARVDQFMIKSMLGEAELGIYTTAVKVSEASTYIIITVIASRFPQLMRLKDTEFDKFRLEITFLLRLALVFALTIFLTFAIGGQYIVTLVFGAEYLAATGPLVVHLAGTLFIYYGVVCTQYLIAKDLEIFRLYRVLWGLVINVILNIILIPRYGLMGAAVATLISQALSAVLFNAFNHKTREIFQLQVNSFAFWKVNLGGKK